MHRLLAACAIWLAALVWSGAAGAWSWPADGAMLRPFSLGSNPYASGQHRGIDVAGVEGSPVRAPTSGLVTFAGSVPASGRGVTILTADGFSVTLFHLGAIGVAKGDAVAEGAPVGTMGWSGEPEQPVPTVHLGIRIAAQEEGYVDPLGLLPARAAPPSPTPVATPVAAPAPAPAAPPAAPPQAASSAASPPTPVASAPSSAAPVAPAPPPAPVPAASGSSPEPSGATPPAAQLASTVPADAPQAGSGTQSSRGSQSGVDRRADGLVIVASPAAPVVEPLRVKGARPVDAARTPARAAPSDATRVVPAEPRSAERPAVSRGPARRGIVRAEGASADVTTAPRPRPVPNTDATPVVASDEPGVGVTRRTLRDDAPATRRAPTAATRELVLRPATSDDLLPLAGVAFAIVATVLVAAAATRRAARRIGSDGAVLRHHADLLRQLDAAHRPRLHDRRGGRLRTPPAAARP